MSQYLDKYPANRNLLSPVGFKFVLDKAPKVDFFSNFAGIPAITLGSALQTRYGKNIDIPGDKMNFEDFRLRFLVDENMENYMEIWNWMTGLGFPYSLEQYSDLWENSDSYKSPSLQGNFYERSDGTLNILNSNFNVQSQVIFEGLYPVYLSALDFDATLEDIRYFTAEVTFKYTYYKIIQKQTRNPQSIPINLGSAPTISLTADKTVALVGDKVTLSWSTTNATKVSINNGVGLINNVNGTADVIFNGNITYTATATGPGGTATDSVTIALGVQQTSANRTCIAVIDESDSQSVSGMETKWTQFRQNWPNRRFYLLQAGGANYGDVQDVLTLPPSFLEETDPDSVDIP